MPVSRRVVGGDERAPRVAGPQQHGLSAATSESTVSATTRHGPRPRVMGELVRTVVAATMALRTARFLARRDAHDTPLSAPARFLARSDTPNLDALCWRIVTLLLLLLFIPKR